MEGLSNTWIDTLSYADARDIVKEKLVASVADFVAAGFFLKHIRDHELYKSAGYESIWDCAWAEFGLKKTSASRCMSFNDKYSLNGNSQDMDEKYLVYNKSQLQEMLYLSDEQLEQVSETTTVREIRAIREEEQLPGQMSVEDYPELMPVATSQQKLLKPDEKQREYLEAFARHFIYCEYDWLLADYTNRVLMVNNSPTEIKQYLGDMHRIRHFETDKGTGHIHLFDEYVQLWDENYKHIGDFDWFYLAAAIQSMWNVIAMEKMSVRRNTETESIATSQQDELYEEIEEDECEEELSELYAEEPEEVIDGEFREIEKEDVKSLWKNNEGRKNWLNNYESWGVWYKDENIGCTYYKYDLNDTDRIIVIKYPPVLFNGEAVFPGTPAYHLVKKGVKNISKYEEKERDLVDYLAKIYRGEI